MHVLKFLDTDKYWRNKRYKNVLYQRTQVARDQGSQRLILDGGNQDSMRFIAGIVNELLERVGDDV